MKPEFPKEESFTPLPNTAIQSCRYIPPRNLKNFIDLRLFEDDASIFKNPQGNAAGTLLDSIGAKTLSCGGVRIWENHANFIVNDNCGTSLDILSLMFDLYSKVKEKYDIELEPEIIFLGGKNEKENELCKILYKK